MKKTNLALAIFAAIAVAACGGSSSNDDAPIDKKPETPVTPIKPTTGGNETPETPKTPEETKPETPAVAGGGAGGAGGKTDGKKPKEKKPEPTPTGGGGGKPNPTTVKQAEAVLKSSEEKLKQLEEQSRAASQKVNQANEPVQRLIIKIAMENAKKPKPEKEIQKLEAELAQKEKEVEAAIAAAQEEQAIADAAVNRQKAEIARNKAKVAELSPDVSAATVEMHELEAKKIDLAQDAIEKATVAAKAAEAHQELADQEQAEQAKFNKAKADAEKAATSKDPEEAEEARKAYEEAEAAHNAFKAKLANAAEEKAKTDNASKQAAQKAKEAATKAAEAVEIAKNVGSWMNAGATLDGKKVVNKIEKKGDNYVVTLTDKAVEIVLSGDKASGIGQDAKYGQFGTVQEKKEADAADTDKKDEEKTKKAVHYALKTNDDQAEVDKMKPTTTAGSAAPSVPTVATAPELKTAYSGFGYIGEDFYHFGQLTDVKQIDDLAKVKVNSEKEGEVKYTGSAFVKEILPATAADAKDAKDENKTEARMLVADVTATADFAGDKTTGLKTFSGAFSKFTPYLDDKGAVLQTLTADENKKVDFVAVIDGNSFKPAEFLPPEKAEANAKVNGNFYGQKAANFGGLVEHKTFSGSFGGTRAPAATGGAGNP